MEEVAFSLSYIMLLLSWNLSEILTPWTRVLEMLIVTQLVNKLSLCLTKYHTLTSSMLKRHPMTAYWGSEGITPDILISALWRWVNTTLCDDFSKTVSLYQLWYIWCIKSFGDSVEWGDCCHACHLYQTSNLPFMTYMICILSSLLRNLFWRFVHSCTESELYRDLWRAIHIY
jgi:hypothetical protein